MAAIDAVNLNEFTLSGADANTVKTILRGVIWQWYNQHLDQVLWSKWFFSVRVRDVRPLFVALVGDEAA